MIIVTFKDFLICLVQAGPRVGPQIFLLTNIISSYARLSGCVGDFFLRSKNGIYSHYQRRLFSTRRIKEIAQNTKCLSDNNKHEKQALTDKQTR